MRFEVITGEDADKARLAGEALESWNNERKKWVTRLTGADVPCDRTFMYRLTPKPPEKRRMPLADLRVLAGAMLVHPDNGFYEVIDEITPTGHWMKSACGSAYDPALLAERGYHYDRGTGPVPCWTEEVGE